MHILCSCAVVCSAHRFTLPEVTVTTALPAELVMAALPSLSLPEASGSTGDLPAERGGSSHACGCGSWGHLQHSGATVSLLWHRLVSSEPQKAVKERKLFQGPGVTAVIEVVLLIFEHVFNDALKMLFPQLVSLKGTYTNKAA